MKTLGQIARQAWMETDLDADHWEATASAVRKAVLEEAIEAISGPLTIAACEDAIAAAQDLQELHIEALQRLMADTDYRCHAITEQAESQGSEQSGNDREAE